VLSGYCRRSELTFFVSLQFQGWQSPNHILYLNSQGKRWRIHQNNSLCGSESVNTTTVPVDLKTLINTTTVPVDLKVLINTTTVPVDLKTLTNTTTVPVDLEALINTAIVPVHPKALINITIVPVDLQYY